MKNSSLLFLACLFAPMALGLAAAQREEAVMIFENRKVSVAVPAGCSFSRGADETGLLNVNLADAGNKVSLQLVFVPDPEGQSIQPRPRKEKMVELFNSFVAGSVEKAMRFEELEPRRGVGTYCVFTDASLVGRTDLPPEEYLHLTVGLKAWRGVVVIFRLYSQDTTSAAYQALLQLLRDGVEERPVPLR